jgi:hypothetical protein
MTDQAGKINHRLSLANIPASSPSQSWRLQHRLQILSVDFAVAFPRMLDLRQGFLFLIFA